MEVAVKRTHSRALVIVGLVLMVAGALDPLEGSVVILGGSALAAIGAYFARTRRYRLQLTACVLIALGVAALFGLSALGGVGGNSGRSIWWLALCVSYPIGWLLGLFGAASNLRENRTAQA
jgi:4-hydroxybenzoate polyprenyltransferase